MSWYIANAYDFGICKTLLNFLFIALRIRGPRKTGNKVGLRKLGIRWALENL